MQDIANEPPDNELLIAQDLMVNNVEEYVCLDTDAYGDTFFMHAPEKIGGKPPQKKSRLMTNIISEVFEAISGQLPDCIMPTNTNEPPESPLLLAQESTDVKPPQKKFRWELDYSRVMTPTKDDVLFVEVMEPLTAETFVFERRR